MTPVFYHVEGSQGEMPREIDTVSSETVVYLRKNIERVEKEDRETGKTVALWNYDEAEITPEGYAAYIGELANAKADYIAMMSDIDMEEV